MSDPRRDQVEALFAAVLEQPADRRPEFLASLPLDADIKSEVSSLLRAHQDRGQLDSIADRLQALGVAARDVSAAELVDRLRPDLGNRYHIEREIARGGMAIVLLAEDLKHGRKVALKILQPSVAASIGPVRFLREITIAARLAHPHILPLHDSGEAGGLLYYVMPYVEGETLRGRLRREGRLSLPEARQVVREVADALSYAHRRDVVHRDIKPENIMFQAGHAVVADFGIARAMTAAGADGSSDTGVILGTPAYMSPEQAAGSKDVDARSDIYSLACVFYEMLTGEPPFTGATAAIVLRRHLQEAPPTPSRIAPPLPEAVANAMRRALAKSPADRFSDAGVFAEALVLPRAPLDPKRKRQAAVLTGVALSGAVLATATVLTWRSGPTHPAASVMAVLPLAAVAGDTALTRLGRDLVLTLSANLDGVGEIRTVDAQTVLAQTRQSGPLPFEQAAQLARRLGASSLVLGTVVPAAGKVRIDLVLFTVDSAHALARASVTANPADLATLTDSLTWVLLGELWRTRAPPTPSVAAVTTRSLPALRAFLEGEQAGLEGRWDAAALAYARAMHTDSTFWLAYWRYSYARWWYLEAVDDSILEPLYAHRFSLPERDRLVLESWWTDSVSVAISRGREAVERYPDYWPGWMQYADWLFHVGPVHGYERSEAQAALERTVALNPTFVPAWEHLFWATIGRDTVAAARAVESLARLDFGRSVQAEFGFDLSRVYRLELLLARSARLDHGLLDSVAHDLATTARGRIGGGATLLPVQVELSRRVLGSRPRPEVAAVHERQLTDAWAGRGAWDSALAVAERNARRSVGGDPLGAYRLAVIGAWLEAVDPDRAVRLRAAPALAVDRAGTSALSRAELAWLDGLLALARRDRAALETARTTLRSTGAVTNGLLDSSLAALGTERREARAAAARMLAKLNWERADLLAPGYDAHPYVIAIGRLAAVRWFLDEGNGAEAMRPLMWFDAWWALDGYRPARRVLAGLAARARARLAITDGNADLARRTYLEFLQRYDLPVPAHRHLTDEARAALQF